MLFPLRSHFLSLPKQHHPLGIRHSNLWRLSFNPPQFYLDRFCLVSFKNLLLLTHTVQINHCLFTELLQILQFLSQETLQRFSVFILETSISTIGNSQFAEKNDQISSQLTKFPWWFCSSLLSHEKPYQPSMTLPRTVLPPMAFIQPVKPATVPPPPRSLPRTLLCWQGSLFALSNYLVQDSVACVHCPSS